MANTIEYGLSEVVLFPIESEVDRKLTYGKAIPFINAVSLTLSAEESESKTYADDKIAHQSYEIQGFSGDIEFLRVPDEIMEQIFGIEKKDGLHIMKTDQKAKKFAMTYRVKGDEKNRKFQVFYASMSRPSITETKTVSENKDNNTVKMKITAAPVPSGTEVYCWADEGTTEYKKMATEVLLPAETPQA